MSGRERRRFEDALVAWLSRAMASERGTDERSPVTGLGGPVAGMTKENEDERAVVSPGACFKPRKIWKSQPLERCGV